MKKLATFLFAIIISISLISCAATLVGDVLYKTAKAAVTIPVTLISSAAALAGGAFHNSTKSNEEKREFMENFNKNNIEREKAGLSPLDLCAEKYHFDESWAKDDPQCKKRVEAYEAGDENALWTSQLKGGKKKEFKEEIRQQIQNSAAYFFTWIFTLPSKASFKFSLLFISPLAMAGELGSSDSKFLFSGDQAAVTTISDQEMDSTQGQVISSLVPLLVQVTGTVESLPVVGSTVSNILNTVFGLLP